MSEVVKTIYEKMKEEKIPFSQFCVDYKLKTVTEEKEPCQHMLVNESKIKKAVKSQGGKLAVYEDFDNSMIVEVRNINNVKDAITIPVYITKATMEIGKGRNKGCLSIDPLRKRYETDAVSEYYLNKIRSVMRKLGIKNESGVLSL